jgi:hypothetical protein
MMDNAMFQVLLPLACDWAEEQERLILRDGVGLTASQLADASRIGIAHPEKVRLRVVEKVPLPSNPILRQAAESTSLISPLTWGERRLVVHELVHTALSGLTLRYGIFIRADHRRYRSRKGRKPPKRSYSGMHHSAGLSVW